MRRFGVTAILLGVGMLLAAGAARAASIDIGAAAGPAGARVAVAVTLADPSGTVVATQNRIDFGRAAFIAQRPDGEPDCAVNPAIDKGASGFRFLPLGCDPAADCTGVRVFVLAFDNLDPIADGAVLYTCAVALAADAAPATYPLLNSEQGAAAAGGVLVASDGSDGAVEVLPAAPAARLRVGRATGAASDVVAVPVSIDLLADAVVAGIQIDLAFDPATPLASGAAGRPACAVNAAIGKEATTFGYLPIGCMPGVDCSGVRAFVLSLLSADPLPDGAILFSCDVAIAAAAAAPGTYPVAASQVGASGPLGEELLVLAEDGAVVVEEPPPPTPCVGDCNGDGMVAINELLLGVNIAAGSVPAAQCPALSPGGEPPTISQLIQAVNAALGGCPA